jgi:hypothetical protein
MESHPKRRKVSSHSTPRPPPSFSIPLTRSHPYNVQPLGNFYLSPTPHSCIPPGLGLLFPLFPDAALLSFLHHFTVPELGLLSSVSKALFVFTHEEELYREAVLTQHRGTFQFHHTWRLTSIFHHIKAHLGQPLIAEATVNELTRIPPPAIPHFYSDLLFQSFYCASLDLTHFSNPDNIPRIHIDDLSLTRFQLEFAIPNRPLLITGLIDRWPARRWTVESLQAKFGTSPFKCGGVNMTLNDYLTYAAGTCDESPLYLFDSGFGEKYPELVGGYEAPACLKEDLFEVLKDIPAKEGYNDGCEDRETPDAHMRGDRGERGARHAVEDERKEAREGDFGSMRPAYRWILIGPARSGSTFHKVSVVSLLTQSHPPRLPSTPSLPFHSVECSPLVPRTFTCSGAVVPRSTWKGESLHQDHR